MRENRKILLLVDNLFPKKTCGVASYRPGYHMKLFLNKLTEMLLKIIQIQEANDVKVLIVLDAMNILSFAWHYFQHAALVKEPILST